MKKIIITLFLLMSSLAYADENKITDLEKRVTELESNKLDLPKSLFINGEIEAYYDDKTYDSGYDSRAELQVGVEQNVNTPYINYVGGSAVYDTHYALDTTQNNTLVEKQLAFGGDKWRLYMGETDAQRYGFAKTPKISAPIIITQPNNRIEHNEKTVLSFGGFDFDNQFDMDSYRLDRDTPYGASIGWDNKGDTLYYNATVSLMGYAEVSYMAIDSKATGANYTKDTKQEGWSIGGSLYRWDIPMVWGVEKWDDKDTGVQSSKDRYDYGVLYSVTDSTYVTAHRTENDDLGYTGNYYGVVYNLYTDKNTTKRPDKRDGIEMGVYYHEKGGKSVYTNQDYTDTQQVLASIKYKF